eukprot:GHUV01024856.1.p1 GENE.GHUV01024856.1~~GHUV01024856.1.p1  ORF type:complete len:119 (+),score=4.98 GHUV01024856.1:342-698(+)
MARHTRSRNSEYGTFTPMLLSGAFETDCHVRQHWLHISSIVRDILPSTAQPAIQILSIAQYRTASLHPHVIAISAPTAEAPKAPCSSASYTDSSATSHRQRQTSGLSRSSYSPAGPER